MYSALVSQPEGPACILRGVHCRSQTLPWRGLLLGLLCVGAGCARTFVPPQTVRAASPLPPVSSATPRVPATILSAHFALNNAPPLRGLDALPVVFSVELDPSTVVAEHFIISRGDGLRSRPKEALLSPANEGDENRTVLLVGDFGAPDDRPPTHVSVSGALYSEEGQALRGLAAPVAAFEVAPTVVYAEVLQPGEGRCEGARAMVRTYWSEGLRGLSPAALERVAVHTESGERLHPTRFDDQASPGSDAAEDNVLDVCMGAAGRPVRLQIEAGILTDPAAHPNAEVDVDVALGRG